MSDGEREVRRGSVPGLRERDTLSPAWEGPLCATLTGKTRDPFLLKGKPSSVVGAVQCWRLLAFADARQPPAEERTCPEAPDTPKEASEPGGSHIPASVPHQEPSGPAARPPAGLPPPPPPKEREHRGKRQVACAPRSSPLSAHRVHSALPPQLPPRWHLPVKPGGAGQPRVPPSDESPPEWPLLRRDGPHPTRPQS